jgi:hypothetical protein
MHKSIKLSRVMNAVKRSHAGLSDPGFCTACGKSCDGVEPDARKYVCESCGAAAVYGAEELLMMIVV